MKKLYIVKVYLYPDMIDRESVIAINPLDAVNKIQQKHTKAIWFDVVGYNLIPEPRCCLHCFDYGEICACRSLRNKECLGKDLCVGTTCSWFKPESQTD